MLQQILGSQNGHKLNISIKIMYKISELTGKIYLNGVEIPLDDRAAEFQQYLIDKDIVGVEYVEATEEEIAEANKQIVQNLKLEHYQELLLTDWYYTRYIETGQEVPLEIKQQRQEIRDKYNNLIQQMTNE